MSAALHPADDTRWPGQSPLRAISAQAAGCRGRLLRACAFVHCYPMPERHWREGKIASSLLSDDIMLVDNKPECTP